MVFVLFLICAAAYDQLVKYALHWFQVHSILLCYTFVCSILDRLVSWSRTGRNHTLPLVRGWQHVDIRRYMIALH